MLIALHALAIFVAAGLLFLVQPMFARMVLPRLGGSPAVWNTCVVFYQATLLAGYLYAHATAVWLGVRRQAVVQLSLLVLACAMLPIVIPRDWAPSADRSTVAALFALLAATIGVPFFVVSATGPMLQRWFATTSDPTARDPYFLYVASNVGSLLALVAYPLVVEPLFTLHAQARLWTGGFTVLIALTGACAVVCGRRDRSEAARDVRWAASTPIPLARRARWVALAFVPSSLMLSVTTYLTTDLEPIPLLWVIPLAIYLLTFVLVFANPPPVRHRIVVRALPIIVLPLVLVLTEHANRPLLLMMALHLTALFVVAMVCHGELAADRPPAGRLTEFYLWLSVGGVLGGAFNALLAPLLFSSTTEYPITLVLACLLGPGLSATTGRDLALDVTLPVALGAVTFVLARTAHHAGWVATGTASLLVLGAPTFVCFSFSRRPVRFGLGIGALLVAGVLGGSRRDDVRLTLRSFYGINEVLDDTDAGFRLLMHGATLHGMQALDPARAREPLAYYHRAGPLGRLFATFVGPRRLATVAVVGLGAGSTGCYADPGQRWDFYEIDPTVERIARDPRYFTYLRDCAPDARVVLGDARLTLAATSVRYDLVILDAYSSDAIPVHLLTREALVTYLARLRRDGVLAFHISNRHLDLEPVLADLARDAGLVALVDAETAISAAQARDGRIPSRWLVMARTADTLGGLASDPHWRVPRNGLGRVWTDEYSNVLAVLHLG
jgi:hypothetical protein